MHGTSGRSQLNRFAIGAALLVLAAGCARPGQEAGRLFSARELGVWRQRAEQGPFKTAGDFATNSPGDWDRIVAHRGTTVPIWRPGEACGSPVLAQDSGGCPDGPAKESFQPVVKAAFHGLVARDAEELAAVRDVLLRQARALDFATMSRWPADTGQIKRPDTAPAHSMGHLLSQLAVAYDFARTAFSESEQREIEQLLLTGARWMQGGTRRQLAAAYSGDFKSVREKANDPKAVTFDGGRIIPYAGHLINNRQGTQVRAIALIAALTGDRELADTAVEWVKAFLELAVFPDGSFAEFERAEAGKPSLGLSYVTGTLEQVAVTADVLARNGDTRAYDLVTKDGISLRSAITFLAGYWDGTYERQIYGARIAPNPSGYTAPPINCASNFIAAANYYDDPYLKGFALQDGSGMPGFAAYDNCFSGQATVDELPATLFLYAQTGVDPYTRQGRQPI